MWRKGNFGVVLGNSMGSNEIYVENVIISTSYNPAFNNAAGSCVSLRILGVALRVRWERSLLYHPSASTWMQIWLPTHKCKQIYFTLEIVFLQENCNSDSIFLYMLPWKIPFYGQLGKSIFELDTQVYSCSEISLTF